MTKMEWNKLKDLIVELENKDTAVPPKANAEDGDTYLVYHCAVCGTPVIVDDNYCSHCGKKLREASDVREV